MIHGEHLDGVGWVTGTYRGYNTSGTSWSQANGVSSTDTIVEQSIPTYDEVGNVVSTASFQRLNDATGTGALSGTAQPLARISYMANWFDGIDRLIASANYGAISNFTRPTTPPASSSTVLVNQTGYDVAGRVSSTTDPAGIVTQNSFDNANRTTQVVEALGSTTPRTTQWTYTLDDLVATMTAVNGATNQTTVWAYGTTSTSGVFRNDLLSSVAYPDSVGGSDVVGYTYNRLGQQLTTTDQRGNTRSFYYDKLGRLTDDGVSTLGSNTDGTVRRINRTYEVRGMVSALTSYDNPTPGSGTILNQCALTYNGFRQLTEEQQEHSGVVTGSSLNVQYGYFPGTGNLNYIRPTSLTYPNGRAVNYTYASGMDSQLSRVTSISDSSATLASYLYLGLGTVIRISYPQPSVWLDLWGGTSGVFAGFDLFGRIIDQRWQNNTGTTPTDIDRYQYGYDQNSNRLWKANVVGTPHVTAGLDEFYVYDPLNRLTTMQRGILNSGRTGLTGTPAVEQDWTLDALGNWSKFATLASGNATMTQTRTSNLANEITAIGSIAPPPPPTGTPTPPAWATPAYDQAGNTTSFPQPGTPSSAYTALCDAWNRMVSVSAGAARVQTNQYDGWNRRILRLTYSGGVLSETRHFYSTNDWRTVEERTGSPAAMDRQYVWGIRYVGELVCRDDNTGTRIFAGYDASFSVTVLFDASADIQERCQYDPYGQPLVLSPGWLPTSDSLGWEYLFQAGRYDTGSQLYSFRNRAYHWALGRWLRRDPMLPPSPMTNVGRRLSTAGSANIVLLRLSQQIIDAVNVIRATVAPLAAGIDQNLYSFAGANPLVNVDPYGLAFKNCEKAIADLEKALAGARSDVEDALALVALGQFPDSGHLKEYSQRMNNINRAMDQVIKYCPCEIGKGAAAALIKDAKDAVRALGDAWNQLMAALSNRQFLASVFAIGKVLAALAALLGIAILIGGLVAA